MRSRTRLMRTIQHGGEGGNDEDEETPKIKNENKKSKSTSYIHRKDGGLGNIYYSEGKRGDVIKIKIKA